MDHVDAAVIGGGQSGLAAAHALRGQGLQPVVLEASEQAAGSWPRYHDSLTLFSPARYSSLSGLPFGGDPDRYPHRDEVVAYLLRCADRLDTEIRTRTRVRDVRPEDGAFMLRLEGGGRLAARAVIAATGTFGHPHRPDLPGPVRPSPAGSTYVNIDACRTPRCCRCSNPPTRRWRRAARR